MDKRFEIAVIGGGIAGAATAAVLSLEPSLKVTLFETAPAIGTATTAKNNGRCHSGASGVFSDLPEVTRRKVLSSDLLRKLPIRWESQLDALYVCGDTLDANAFMQACDQRGIRLRNAQAADLEGWIDQDKLDQCFLLAEPSFDPIELTERLAAICISRGGTVRTCSRVERLVQKGNQLFLQVNGDTVGTDFVVDVTSKFAGSVKLDDRQPLVNVKWFRWPIVTIAQDRLPGLSRVITCVDQRTRTPSVIPHGRWTTLDCKTLPQSVDSPTAYPANNPAAVNLDNEQEQHIVESSAAFMPFRAWSTKDFENAHVFYGIQGRRAGEEKESDICRTYAYPGVDNYVLRHGGLATSAVLDALETGNDVRARLNIQAISLESSISLLAEALESSNDTTRASRMIYANVP